MLIVTEYGADVDPRLHSPLSPEQFGLLAGSTGLVYNRHYLEQMRKRPFIAGLVALEPQTPSIPSRAPTSCPTSTTKASRASTAN
ncbi:MAG: hypothetical protein ACLSHL_09930 [Alistipes communis]